MKRLLYFLTILIGGIITQSGYEATNSWWSLGYTIPLAVIWGFVVTMIISQLREKGIGDE